MLKVELNNPLDVEWEITNACNLRCRHCYVAAGEKLEQELDTGEALRLVDELDRIGVTDITISGGEPLLRSDLWLVLEELKNRKIPFTLYTNATLLDREKTRKLSECTVKHLSLSLNGASAKTHNFVQNANTFDKVLGAIRNLKDSGIRVQVLFTLMKVNADEFDALMELSRKTGIDSVCIYPFYPQGRGVKNLQDLALNEKDTIEFLEKAVKHPRRPPDVYVGGCLSQRFTPKKKSSLIRGNPCGKLTAIVSADGHLRPCNFLPYKTKHSIREKSISELWSEPVFENVRNWREKLTGKIDCERCSHFPVCLGTCLSIHSRVGS